MLTVPSVCHASIYFDEYHFLKLLFCLLLSDSKGWKSSLSRTQKCLLSEQQHKPQTFIQHEWYVSHHQGFFLQLLGNRFLFCIYDSAVLLFFKVFLKEKIQEIQSALQHFVLWRYVKKFHFMTSLTHTSNIIHKYLALHSRPFAQYPCVTRHVFFFKLNRT